MKTPILLTILCCALTVSAFAESTYRYDNGEVDPVAVADLVDEIEPSFSHSPISQNPPIFRSDEHRQSVVDDLNLALVELQQVEIEAINDPQVLTDLALLHQMGSQVELASSDQATAFFEAALDRDANNRRAHYLYGLFLSSSHADRFDAVPHLEKVLELGRDEAGYPLGMLLVERGETERGLTLLTEYARAHADSDVMELVKRIERRSAVVDTGA